MRGGDGAVDIELVAEQGTAGGHRTNGDSGRPGLGPESRLHDNDDSGLGRADHVLLVPEKLAVHHHAYGQGPETAAVAGSAAVRFLRGGYVRVASVAVVRPSTVVAVALPTPPQPTPTPSPPPTPPSSPTAAAAPRSTIAVFHPRYQTAAQAATQNSRLRGHVVVRRLYAYP